LRGDLAGIIDYEQHWQPDTCFCLVNEKQKKFVTRCRIHQNATYAQLLNHNKANANTGDPEEIQEQKRRTEKETTRR